MRLKKICVLLFLMTALNAFSQEKFTLSGTVVDNSNNETLIGASIIILDAKNASATTNSCDFYSITLPKGDYAVIISYLGFENNKERISLAENTTKNFAMLENTTTLGEVVVTTNEAKTKIQKPEMSVNKLPISTIKKMPAVMGEVDVLKSILQLPGVTNAQEGASGFNVRGGSVDGNLVLLEKEQLMGIFF